MSTPILRLATRGSPLALAQAHLVRASLADIDAVAATAGPGLIGGVMVGLVSAKALALGCGK
ncbi:MAG TPA: hypothetical protein VEU95_16920, partial [Micropepsaceae bacterium]|nr:hypothetical protein [Micropepsaceae bacterium]